MSYLQQIVRSSSSSSNGTNGDGTSGRKNKTDRPKVVIFGNVLLDRTVHIADYALLDRYHLTPNQRGELDSVTLSRLIADACAGAAAVTTNPGGSGLNSTRILHQLGTSAVFCGAIGLDETGGQLVASLENHIDARLQMLSDEPTGECICLIHQDTSTLFANIGASRKFSADFLKQTEKDKRHSLVRPNRRKQIFYIEGYFVPQREYVCDYIVEHYVRGRHRLAFNLSAPYIVKENFNQVLRMCRKATFVFGNNEEFKALASMMGVRTFEQVAEQLIKEGGRKLLLITQGAEGVHVITDMQDEHRRLPKIMYTSYKAATPTKVVDTTGAGDAFVAAFLHAWLAKNNLNGCIQMANEVAAAVVSQIGCTLTQ